MARKRISRYEKLKNARVGYQVAANICFQSGALVWSQFNVLLVANSIIIVAIGMAMTSSTPDKYPIFLILMPGLGICLCIFWLLIMIRGTKQYDYYMYSARELEEKYLSNPIKTLSRGGDFLQGENIKIEIKQRSDLESYKLNVLGKLPMRYASIVVIVIFGIIYGGILIYNSLLCNCICIY